MDKFIYVFNDSARDVLLEHDYKLLKQDKKEKVYVFANEGMMSFTCVENGISYLTSDTLTF